MEEIVQKILENAKNLPAKNSPRQLFFRHFDALLTLAQQQKDAAQLAAGIEVLHQYAQEAQMSSLEMAARKKTLLWTFHNAA